MRLIHFAVTASVVAASTFGFAAFNKWQRGLILNPRHKLSQVPSDRALRFSEQKIPSPGVSKMKEGIVSGWWIPHRSPQAPAILYLHGNAETMSNSLEKIQKLYEIGFSILTVDYRGFGKSTPEVRPTSFE